MAASTVHGVFTNGLTIIHHATLENASLGTVELGDARYGEALILLAIQYLKT